MAKQAAGASGDSFMTALRNSPATKALAEQAKGLVEAQANRVVGKVGDGIAGTADKLTKVGETGELPPIADGAKRLLQGDNPVKAAAGAATSGLGQKAKGLLDKIMGKGKGSGRAKAMNIEETLDVGVPVATAYNQWTQFQDFTRFMKGVESVEQSSETETNWRVKVFKSRRTWKANTQEQVPDERIVWTSEGAKGSTKGVVTFHPLGDNLTRILVAIEYYPSGFFEKTGNLWRAAGRRARLDLKNFRRFVMMEGEATGEWRGEIRDGEVVDAGEDGAESQDDSGAESQDDSGEDAAQSQHEERPRRRRRSGEDVGESQEDRPRRRRASGAKAPAKKASPQQGRASSSATGGQRKPSARAAKAAESSSEGTRRRRSTGGPSGNGARSTRASGSSGNGSRRSSGTRSASASNGGSRRATKATGTTRSRAGSRSS